MADCVFPLSFAQGHAMEDYMRKLLFASCILLLQSCSPVNDIKIPRSPCLTPQKGIQFTLCKKFDVTINDFNLTIPAGFTTDLASVPRILWIFEAPNDTETIPGSIIHDYLYSNHCGFNRKEIDAIYYDALLLTGASKYTAFKYWLGVRVFGYNYFDNYFNKKMVIDATNESRIENDDTFLYENDSCEFKE